MRHWLMKTEPDTFGIEHLARAPGKTTAWDGVRNYQARNMLRDQMKLGDRVLVYHSSCDPPAVAGVARIVREGYPDHTAWDPQSDHFDPKSPKESPRWFMVDIQLETTFDEPIPLSELREMPELKQMELLKRGSRLSVQPVREAEFKAILKRAGQPTKK